MHTCPYIYIYIPSYAPTKVTPSDLSRCLMSSITSCSSSISLRISIRLFQVFGFAPLLVVTQSSSSALQQSLGDLHMHEMNEIL